MVDSPYYMTPEQFMGALSDAIHEAYYRDQSWTTKHHPEDLAFNVIAVCESIAGFMATLIRNEMYEKRRHDEGLDRLLAVLRKTQDEQDYREFNDAYVEPEGEE